MGSRLRRNDGMGVALGSAMLALMVLVSPMAQAQAQAFPAKPVRIIVSSAAGGASDTVARLIAEQLAAQWQQSVIVENRTGGAAVIATEILARATPDGHTLALLGSTLATNPAVRSDLRYDTARDLRPILYFGAAPAALTVRADFPARTPAEFFVVVKAAPGKYSYGSPGISTNGHRSAELLKRAMGLSITHVPYKGAVPAVTDLIGGQIAMLMATPTAFMQHIKAGRLKAIAVTSARRFPTMPDVPTFAESGVPNFDHVEWWMFVVPARVPEAVEARLHKDLSAVVAQPEFRQRVLNLDIETFPNTREASREHLRRELARWARDAKALGLMP
jgi:tripartite-type tricarboxylate transporter receptor subunit TctC